MDNPRLRPAHPAAASALRYLRASAGAHRRGLPDRPKEDRYHERLHSDRRRFLQHLRGGMADNATRGTWHAAAAVADVKVNEPVACSLGQHEIAICLVDGAYYATSNICT